MRVLALAYACEPSQGSEPGIGWNCVQQISRRHEVWVITRSANREAIEAACREQPMPLVHWVYFDLPRWARWWKRKTRGVHLYYVLWQAGAYVIARRLHATVQFDIAHHLTFGNYWMGSSLALLPVSFVWGPVSGGESSPPSFRRTFGLRGRLIEWVRDQCREVMRYNPLVRASAKRSTVALATTGETAARIADLGARRIEMMLSVALPAEDLDTLRTAPLRKAGPFRAVSIGRLLHWKGFHLAMQAFRKLHDRVPESEYWIIGEGPERTRLVRLAQQLGISERVRFLGRLSRSETMQCIAETDVMLHPSLHESGGYVCIEAMAAGRPVICLDLGGPALQVTEECGIKVPADTPEQAVNDLGTALVTLAENPELRTRFANAARRRAEKDFNWDTNGGLLVNWYSPVATVNGPASVVNSDVKIA